MDLSNDTTTIAQPVNPKDPNAPTFLAEVLFSEQLYTEYKEFQSSIELPKYKSLY